MVAASKPAVPFADQGAESPEYGSLCEFHACKRCVILNLVVSQDFEEEATPLNIKTKVKARARVASRPTASRRM